MLLIATNPRAVADTIYLFDNREINPKAEVYKYDETDDLYYNTLETVMLRELKIQFELYKFNVNKYFSEGEAIKEVAASH